MNGLSWTRVLAVLVKEFKQVTRDRVTWAIVTRGTDSFDVAELTLTYTYLAPQQ